MADPVDDLLTLMQSALRARQRDADSRIDAVQSALEDYRRAVRAQLALEFAQEHGFKRPPLCPQGPPEAAARLQRTVAALPELAAAEICQSKPEPPVKKTKKAAPKVPPNFERLSSAVASGSLVIVGGLARVDRLARIPEGLRSAVEWIDTSRGGSHAIGNLAQRIRQRRVAALIIIDGQVGHKHTDPLVTAAREIGIAIAYAGKGGQNALLRAAQDLEKMLSTR